ncbi:EAL domain-containing protein [Pseudomonas mendocina]|uniref:EAL domain-containing protein n=1 Tax=Ectopseudomonas mendocina TaxID=300 RepID=UPI0023DC2F20|nr:EAL domain-containing protein [Pseudomonas mendocina]MDF2073541.1 EAL domain-containing protein [Pseudomonas mendocina]
MNTQEPYLRSATNDPLNDLQRAHMFYDELQRGRFHLAFQPVVATNEPGRVLYRESLLRHDGDGLGFNPFPLLERLHVIRPLDHRVIGRVMVLLRDNPSLTLGCNISALSTVLDADWDQMLDYLTADRSLAGRLIIEITESAVPPSTRGAVDLVQRLRHAGCRVAVDDFGSGFGTLAFIQQSQPDIIKIDQSYIQRARDSATGEKTLKYLLELCKTLAPCVIVEGIETSTDLQLAASQGSTWVQGYFFGRPTCELEHLQGSSRITN